MSSVSIRMLALAVGSVFALLAVPAVAQSADAKADEPAADSRAQSHNSSRSNRTEGVAAPAGSGDCDDDDPCVHPGAVPTRVPVDAAAGSRGVAAQDYNSSRSNKAGGERVDADGDKGADGDQSPRARTYNSSRSNRTGGVARPAVDEPCDDCGPEVRERRVVAPKP